MNDEGSITPEDQAILDSLYSYRKSMMQLFIESYQLEYPNRPVDPYYGWLGPLSTAQLERQGMTKKHYELIALGIKNARINMAHATLFTRDQVVEFIASSIADGLARDNPRFDKERFLSACKEEL